MSDKDNLHYERKTYLHTHGWNWTFAGKPVKKRNLYPSNDFALIRPAIRRDA